MQTSPKTLKKDFNERLGEETAAIKSTKRKDTSSHEVSQPSKWMRFDGDAGGKKVETQRAKPTGTSSHVIPIYKYFMHVHQCSLCLPPPQSYFRPSYVLSFHCTPTHQKWEQFRVATGLQSQSYHSIWDSLLDSYSKNSNRPS